MKKLGINVLTLIVGAGALDAELKSHQKELGLTNTHFVGRQGADVVRALQNISDVFLAPSDNEPDGLVYKECMLCNQPFPLEQLVEVFQTHLIQLMKS